MKLGETNREVFLKLISLNLKLDNPAKALTLARIGPRDPAFTLEAARLFINADYKSQAQELLEPLVQDPAPSAEALFFLANIAFEADGPEEALALLRRVPADSPLDAKAAGFRAQILLLQQRGDKALADIRSARARHPDDPELPEAEA